MRVFLVVSVIIARLFRARKLDFMLVFLKFCHRRVSFAFESISFFC